MNGLTMKISDLSACVWLCVWQNLYLYISIFNSVGGP